MAIDYKKIPHATGTRYSFPENLLRDLLDHGEFTQLCPPYKGNKALWLERVMWYLDNKLDERARGVLLDRYKNHLRYQQIADKYGFKNRTRPYMYLARKIKTMSRFENIVWITYGEEKWLEKVAEYDRMIEEKRTAWNNREKWKGKKYKVDTLVFGEALQDYTSGLITKSEFAKRCGVDGRTLTKYMDLWCEFFLQDIQSGAIIVERVGDTKTE